MKTTNPAEKGIFWFWVLLGALIPELIFVSVGKCQLALPASGSMGVVFNPAFPPSVPPGSATGPTTYHYQWVVAANGNISVSSDGQCASYNDVGSVQLNGYANTTEETVQGGNAIATGAQVLVSHTSGNSGCGTPWCSGNAYNWSQGNGTTDTVDWICTYSCKATPPPNCMFDFLWYPFGGSSYPCSDLTTIEYESTNSSGDLLWQIAFTYPTNVCLFVQSATIDDCCDGVTIQPYIRGVSTYFDVYVYMAAGVTPPSLASLGMYAGSLRLFPGFASSGGESDGGGSGGSGSGGGANGGTWTQLAPNLPALFAANGPLGWRTTAGSDFAIYLKEDGSAWSWGPNNYGVLGNGIFPGSLNATRVSGVTGLVQVAAGEYHCLALATNGSVWAWGGNMSGQVGFAISGSGTSYPSAVTNPIPVFSGYSGGSPQPLVGASQVAASVNGVGSYALMTNGTVLAWGDNTYGQQGNGRSGGINPVPALVNGLSGVISIAAGTGHVLALTTNGTIYAWGYNHYGQLGNGTNAGDGLTPALVTALTNTTIVSITTGAESSYAVDSSGNVWAWGQNTSGQLGDGTTQNRLLPALVHGLSATSQIVGISAGVNHCLALASDGSFWAWGDNSEGELGDGTLNQSLVPEHLLFPDNTTAIAISAGAQMSYSIQSDLSVRSWGSNYPDTTYEGSLGRVVNGSYSATPGQVNPF